MSAFNVNIDQHYNSCYYNAILHVIYHTPEIHKIIKSIIDNDIQPKIKSGDDDVNNMVLLLPSLFKELDETSKLPGKNQNKMNECTFWGKPRGLPQQGHADSGTDTINNQGDAINIYWKIIKFIYEYNKNKEFTVPEETPSQKNMFKGAEFKSNLVFISIDDDKHRITFNNNEWAFNQKFYDTLGLKARAKKDASVNVSLSYISIPIFEGQDCRKPDVIDVPNKIKNLPYTFLNSPVILTIHLNRTMEEESMPNDVDNIKSQLPNNAPGNKIEKWTELHKQIKGYFDVYKIDAPDEYIDSFIWSMYIKEGENNSNSWLQYRIPSKRGAITYKDANNTEHSVSREKVLAQYYITFLGEEDEQFNLDEKKELVRIAVNKKNPISEDFLVSLTIDQEKTALLNRLKKAKETAAALKKLPKYQNGRKCMTPINFDNNATINFNDQSYDLCAVCIHRSNTHQDPNYNPAKSTVQYEKNNWTTMTGGGHWFSYVNTTDGWAKYDGGNSEIYSEIDKNTRLNGDPEMNETASILVYRKRLVETPVSSSTPAPVDNTMRNAVETLASAMSAEVKIPVLDDNAMEDAVETVAKNITAKVSIAPTENQVILVIGGGTNDPDDELFYVVGSHPLAHYKGVKGAYDWWKMPFWEGLIKICNGHEFKAIRFDMGSISWLYTKNEENELADTTAQVKYYKTLVETLDKLLVTGGVIFLDDICIFDKTNNKLDHGSNNPPELFDEFDKKYKGAYGRIAFLSYTGGTKNVVSYALYGRDVSVINDTSKINIIEYDKNDDRIEQSNTKAYVGIQQRGYIDYNPEFKYINMEITTKGPNERYLPIENSEKNLDEFIIKHIINTSNIESSVKTVASTMSTQEPVLDSSTMKGAIISVAKNITAEVSASIYDNTFEKSVGAVTSSISNSKVTPEISVTVKRTDQTL